MKKLFVGLLSAGLLFSVAAPAMAHEASVDGACPVRSYVLSATDDNKNPKVETITGPVSGLVVGQSVANVNPTFTATGAFSIKIRWATTVGGSNYTNGNSDTVDDNNFNSGSCVGPQGPAGPPGADGIDGEDGEDGADGTNGVAGSNGLNGFNGVNGKDGVDGKDGSITSTVITVTETTPAPVQTPAPAGPAPTALPKTGSGTNLTAIAALAILLGGLATITSRLIRKDSLV